MTLKKIPCLFRSPGSPDIRGAVVSKHIHLCGHDHSMITLYKGRLLSRKGMTLFPRASIMLVPMGTEQGLMAPHSVVAACTIRDICHPDMQKEVDRLKKIVLDKDLQIEAREEKIYELEKKIKSLEMSRVRE